MYSITDSNKDNLEMVINSFKNIFSKTPTTLEEAIIPLKLL